MRKNTAQSLGGMRANRNGEFFEKIIEISCLHYRKTGTADIQKTPEPMRIIRPVNRVKGQFLAVFEKQAQPDFKGVLKGGQAVMFEAKHTSGTNIEQKRLTAEQIENFNRQHKLGADCFILVAFEMKRFYKVPWELWRDMQTVIKKKSLNEKDLVPYQIVYQNGLLQFLD